MKKTIFYKVATVMVASLMMLSSIPVSAAQQMPASIIRDGREFVMDVTAGGGSGTATPDKGAAMSRSSYKVTASDVRLYIDYSHGHGGDHFAAGYVDATAPRFTARAEVWSNGRLDTTGSNNLNSGKRANGCSYLAVGIVSNAKPRIFYNW